MVLVAVLSRIAEIVRDPALFGQAAVHREETEPLEPEACLDTSVLYEVWGASALGTWSRIRQEDDVWAGPPAAAEGPQQIQLLHEMIHTEYDHPIQKQIRNISIEMLPQPTFLSVRTTGPWVV